MQKGQVKVFCNGGHRRPDGDVLGVHLLGVHQSLGDHEVPVPPVRMIELAAPVVVDREYLVRPVHSQPCTEGVCQPLQVPKDSKPVAQACHVGVVVHDDRHESAVAF